MGLFHLKVVDPLVGRILELDRQDSDGIRLLWRDHAVADQRIANDEFVEILQRGHRQVARMLSREPGARPSDLAEVLGVLVPYAMSPMTARRVD